MHAPISFDFFAKKSYFSKQFVARLEKRVMHLFESSLGSLLNNTNSIFLPKLGNIEQNTYGTIVEINFSLRCAAYVISDIEIFYNTILLM